MSLPSAEEARAAPGAARQVVQGLVRESLQEAWRHEHDTEEFLSELGALVGLHLSALADPGEGTFAGAAQEHEEACAACLKLARNLCAGRPRVQDFWWRSGTVEALIARLREDARLPDERDPAWCEAVPSFLTNAVAANEALRVRAVGSWFPFAMATACTLSSRRPELAFMLVQTLLPAPDPAGGAAPQPLALLSDTEDGHCVLFVLASLLFRGGVGMSESREAVSERAWEWASIFMQSLLTSGGFVPAYLGVQRLTVETLHAFWCSAVGLPTGVKATAPAGVLERLVGRLCHRSEVLGLFWHSVSGLDSPPVAEALLADPGLEDVAARELAGSLAALAREWGLAWRPPAPVPTEACLAFGVQESEVDVRLLAAGAEEDGLGACGGEAEGRGVVFGQLLSALVTLSGGPAAGRFPARLAAVCLAACVSFLDALHRLRFGENAEESVAKKAKPPPEAVEASRACSLIDQVRLCANLLYERRAAQDFVRHIGGLRVLLCHCYADGELPLLREVGVFAVRNASHGNAENQGVMRELLASRAGDGPSADVFDPVSGDLVLAEAEAEAGLAQD